jgi:heterodisulfide reductase subunit A
MIEPDWLVLSVATVPNPDNEELGQILKVPLSRDKFFLEAHMKLRPVEFATDGIFLCGLAHSPKYINECVSQGNAAVSRACTILSKEQIEAEGIVSTIDLDKCTGCGTCIVLCPFSALEKDEDDKAKVTEVLCKGCGTCASSCPEKAASLRNYSDEQLIAQLSAAIKDIQVVHTVIEEQKDPDAPEGPDVPVVPEVTKVPEVPEAQEIKEEVV